MIKTSKLINPVACLFATIFMFGCFEAKKQEMTEPGVILKNLKFDKSNLIKGHSIDSDDLLKLSLSDVTKLYGEALNTIEVTCESSTRTM